MVFLLCLVWTQRPGMDEELVGGPPIDRKRRATRRETEDIDRIGNACRSIVDEIVPQFIDDCMVRIHWARYAVVGFSTTFAQTFSSLLLAKRLKERYPNMRIVFGGANVDVEMGFELLKAFDWVNYVVQARAKNVRATTGQRLLRKVLERLPGVSIRNGEGVIAGFADARMLLTSAIRLFQTIQII